MKKNKNIKRDYELIHYLNRELVKNKKNSFKENEQGPTTRPKENDNESKQRYVCGKPFGIPYSIKIQ